LYEEAIPVARQILALVRQNQGEDNESYQTCLRNLATLCAKAGEASEEKNAQAAAEFFREAIDIRARVLGEDHPDTTSVMNWLGELYRSNGDYAAAAAMHRRALDARRRAHGAVHIDVAHSLNHLALSEDHLGHHAEAESLH